MKTSIRILSLLLLFISIGASAATGNGNPYSAPVAAAGSCAEGCSKKGGMCICPKPDSGGCPKGCNKTTDGKCRCKPSLKSPAQTLGTELK